jgi:hypothetical protein
MTLAFIWSPKQGSVSWWNNQGKVGLIMSQPSHFREVLMGNTITSSHHARIVSPSFSFENKKQ